MRAFLRGDIIIFGSIHHDSLSVSKQTRGAGAQVNRRARDRPSSFSNVNEDGFRAFAVRPLADARQQNLDEHRTMIELTGKVENVGLLHAANELSKAQPKFVHVLERRDLVKEITSGDNGTRPAWALSRLNPVIQHHARLVEFKQSVQLLLTKNSRAHH